MNDNNIINSTEIIFKDFFVFSISEEAVVARKLNPDFITADCGDSQLPFESENSEITCLSVQRLEFEEFLVDRRFEHEVVICDFFRSSHSGVRCQLHFVVSVATRVLEPIIIRSGELRRCDHSVRVQICEVKCC